MEDEVDLEAKRLLRAFANPGSLVTVEQLLPLFHNAATIKTETGKTLLHYACRHGWQNITATLVEQHSCVLDSKDELGLTPLHEACTYGQDRVVRYLISEQNCSTKCQNVHGNTPLHVACANCHADIVKILITQNCDSQLVLQNKRGLTPLHFASMHGKLEIVQMLSNKKTDLQCQDNDGNTPLHLACLGGHLTVVNFLVTICTSDPCCQNYNHDTPLHLACLIGHLKLTKFLIGTEYCDPRALCQNKDGNTPLHLACIQGHIEVVKFLIEKGCDPHSPNKYGNAPLHAICKYGTNVKLNLEVVRFFLITLNCDPKYHNSDGYTPLHLAYEHSNWEVMKMFILHNHHDECQDNNGDTLLHWACSRNDSVTVRFLLSSGKVNTECRNRMGDRPLDLTTIYGIVEMFAAELSDSDESEAIESHPHTAGFTRYRCRSHHFNTPLHDACKRGDMNVVCFLIRRLYVNCDSMQVHNSDGYTPLHLAYISRSWEILKFLIDQNYHDQCRDGNGDTLLHWACSTNYSHTVKFLLSTGKVDTLCRNGRGELPLHLASKYEIVKIFAEFSDSREEHVIEPNDSQRTPKFELYCFRSRKCATPLHDACERGDVKTVEFLVNRQYYNNVQARNSVGHTPLHLAYQSRSWEIVKLLIERNYHDQCRDDNDDTLLHWACSNNDSDAVKLLLSSGKANTFCRNKNGEIPLSLASKYDIVKLFAELSDYSKEQVIESDTESTVAFSRFCANYQGDTPLHYACRRGDMNVVIFITNRPCIKMEIQTLYGSTPFHLACQHGHLKVLQFLITKNYDSRCHDNYGSTPLHLACRGGHLQIVKYLLEQMHDLLCRDSDGRTPLHYASESGYFEIVKCIVKLLVEWNCGLQTQENDGSTPLHLACRNGHLNIVKFLIAQNCETQTQNNSGSTPLHLACKNGHFNIVKFLIEQKCEPQCEDNYGDTPFHLACLYGRIDIVKLLLSTGRVDIYLKNKDGKMAPQLTTDYRVLKLITIAAKCVKQYSLNPYVKVFVFGNAGVGKTTLVKVMENKVNSLFGPVAGQLRNVSGVTPQTAGISVVNLQSKRFGKLSIHDLAGHHEYYASHEALIQNIVSASASLFLVVVKLSDPEPEIIRSLQYWLSFVQNSCSTVNAIAHVVVIGSYEDIAKTASEDFIRKQYKIEETCQASTLIQYKGFVPLDCRKLASTNLDMLYKLVQRSCSSLRSLTPECRNIFCHVLYGLLVTKFQERVACKVRDIVAVFAEEEYPPLPTDPFQLNALLNSLSNSGQILYLPEREDVEEGWVITNKQALLSEINGGMFAPEVFQKYHKLSNSTGVVPKHRIEAIFPEHDADMIASVLTYFEFCHSIKDYSTLSLIVGDNEDSELHLFPGQQYYFFPALVHANRPGHVWQFDSPTHYQCGWCLQCIGEGQYFTPRFLHILLLRLAFAFALPDCSQHAQASPVMRRRCTIWNSGIQWLNEDGIHIVVDMIEQNQKLLLLMSSLQLKEMACIMYRSTLIQKVLEIKQKFCLSIQTEEYFVSPTTLASYPWNDAGDYVLFSMTDIIKAIKKGKDCVVDTTGRQNVELEFLFYFEPYTVLSQQTLSLLLRGVSAQNLEARFLRILAKDLTKRTEELIPQARSLPLVDKFLRTLGVEATVVCDSQNTLTDLYLSRLVSWKDSGGTYGKLRSILEKYSIFGGRDMLDMGFLSTASLSAPEFPIPPAHTLQSATHLNEDNSPLGIESLLAVRTELMESVTCWSELGIALGLLPSTVETIRISCSKDIGQSLTEMLGAWLQMRDRVTTPSWQVLCKALQSSTVGQHLLAETIVERRRSKVSPTPELPQHFSDGKAFLQEVDDAILDLDTLPYIKASLLKGGSHFSWFDLGLALGLLYGTLKRIEEERRGNFDECLVDVLVKWLQQKDRVRDLPSWKSLVGTLMHPLLKQRGLARQIAQENHKTKGGGDCGQS